VKSRSKVEESRFFSTQPSKERMQRFAFQNLIEGEGINQYVLLLPPARWRNAKNGGNFVPNR